MYTHHYGTPGPEEKGVTGVTGATEGEQKVKEKQQKRRYLTRLTDFNLVPLHSDLQPLHSRLNMTTNPVLTGVQCSTVDFKFKNLKNVLLEWNINRHNNLQNCYKIMAITFIKIYLIIKAALKTIWTKIISCVTMS